jgi:Spy/CpxP family protein refolding chaperone
MNLRNCLVGSVAALLLGVGLTAIAEDATTNPSGDEPKSTHVRVPAPYNLLSDLSDDQEAKIKDIHADILDQERQLKEKEHDEIAAVLTDDQKKEVTDLESKAALEKKAETEERRAKSEEEKAESLKDKADGGASTQPSGGQ